MSHLSASQQEELNPGLTRRAQHHITLKEPGPIRVPSYRIPAQMVPKLKKELETIKEMQ